ncbi:hypothetical protein GCM10010094_55860 [Streptomyces flaveus]|uniref:Uncharacterized protein n=1 Tax=Streptomyces flaveus TaxID=66370 RepID=A0A917R3B4_9ACTN|nr:hypothetical protein GCM10010094_55860 [Streptomyces flaveus]
MYGCQGPVVLGRLARMTTHRATKPTATPSQPVERVLMAGLILAVLAGVGWIVGMIYTVMGW